MPKTRRERVLYYYASDGGIIRGVSDDNAEKIPSNNYTYYSYNARYTGAFVTNK